MHFLRRSGHWSCSQDSCITVIVRSNHVFIFGSFRYPACFSIIALVLAMIAAQSPVEFDANSGNIRGTHWPALHLLFALSRHCASSLETSAASHAVLYLATTGARSSSSA